MRSAKERCLVRGEGMPHKGKEGKVPLSKGAVVGRNRRKKGGQMLAARKKSRGTRLS